jgi:hypothetical protein
LEGGFGHNTTASHQRFRQLSPALKKARRPAMLATQLESWDVQRRRDGALLVRVHSRDRQGRPLPDAVFTFRLGDPQYDYWERQLRQRNRPNDRTDRPLSDEASADDS